MTTDILSKAKVLLGNNYEKKALPSSADSLAKAKKVMTPQSSLDVYVVFDTTGSMGSYITQVKDNLAQVTDALLDGKSDLRLSMNGVGDHCDGANELQFYALSKKAEEVRGSIEDIVMTSGGDEPEAYECLALAMAKRLPTESAGRKRAVVLVGDSVPHGMTDAPCHKQVDYKKSFEALKTVTDGFYFVGCAPETYHLQKQLIDNHRKDREQFIPLGKMVEVLPSLLIALAKKTESEKAFIDYMKNLEKQNPAIAGKVYGLFPKK